MEYDFIVGFTLFTPKGFKTRFRHFDNLRVAKMFASNVNLKDNSKIYVDLKYLQDKIERIIQILEAKPYTAYTLYGDILHESDEIAQMLKEVLEKE